jgi:hypothetical protein
LKLFGLSREKLLIRATRLFDIDRLNALRDFSLEGGLAPRYRAVPLIEAMLTARRQHL